MDYEKAYKEAIERAKAEQETFLKGGNISGKSAIERIFPELYVNEDERIKNEIIAFIEQSIHRGGGTPIPQEQENKWIAWLEKQDEQKHTDKVESKFKVGDWITNGGLLVGQVTSFDGEYYHYMCEGIEQPLHISNVYNWHLWTIQDAKNGDVLKEDSCIFIIERMKPDGTAIVHCCLFDDGDFDLVGSNLSFDVDSTYPATKEQRDLLFQKMKEAGYKWDAENKKLNKIEQESTWNEKIKGLNELETYILSLVPDRSLDAIKVDAKNIRYIINKEQKSAEWSEKDSKILNEIIEELTPYGECPDYPSPEEQEYYYTRTSMIDWLKSIKDRVQPQPKKEWSKEDEERIEFLIAMCDDEQAECVNNSTIYRECTETKDWLKSLKDRVQPQLKQEWREKDDKILNTIIKDIQERHPEAMWKINSGNTVAVSTEYIIDWLKSFKPNYWKPSKQNIKDLEWCADLVKDKMGVGFHRLQVFIDELKSL